EEAVGGNGRGRTDLDEEPPPVVMPRPGRPRRGGPSEGVREPEAGAPVGLLAGARAMPRNLAFNDPGEVLSGSRSTATAFGRGEPKEAQGGTDEVQTVRREGPKVGRNDPCPCGSGKKYKKCHGA